MHTYLPISSLLVYLVRTLQVTEQTALDCTLGFISTCCPAVTLTSTPIYYTRSQQADISHLKQHISYKIRLFRAVVPNVLSASLEFYKTMGPSHFCWAQLIYHYAVIATQNM